MNRLREKLINAFIYFVSNTENCGITKIGKLIYFFEFEHFGQTGVPPIGLTYCAAKQGPLSYDFWGEINKGVFTSDFNDVATATPVTYNQDVKGHLIHIKDGIYPNMKIFSPREQRIMKEVAEKYRYASAVDMSEISHEDKKPWNRTIKEKGINSTIDYLYAIDENSPISLEEAESSLSDFNEVNSLFGQEATGLQW
jgi:uncharacterized phage-associated protein